MEPLKIINKVAINNCALVLNCLTEYMAAMLVKSPTIEKSSFPPITNPTKIASIIDALIAILPSNKTVMTIAPTVKGIKYSEKLNLKTNIYERAIIRKKSEENKIKF